MMKRNLLHSALLHLSLLIAFYLFSVLLPEPNIIWLEGTGFDFNGGGGGGTGGRGGKTGQTAKTSLKKAKRGQEVPKPVQTKVPDQPAPAQKAQKGEEVWKVKTKTRKEDPAKKAETPQPVKRGETTKKEQSNIIRRGVEKGSEAGDGEFDFGEGQGDGTGLPVGIGFGPGEGSGFGFGSYLGILRKRIWSEWVQYTTLGSDKSCVIGLTVSKRGQVSHIKVETSSGDALFDNVARRSVRNSSPLPPLPSGFPKSEQRFRIKFQLID